MNNDSRMYKNKYGNKVWRNSRGEIHRKDDPAFIQRDGHEEWRINGQLHRLDGPAIIYANNDRVWYVNGVLHREDGPAIIWIGGRKFWHLHGIEFKTKEDYFDALPEYAKAKCLFSQDFLNA